MSSETNWDLKIIVTGPMADFAYITLYNGYLETVYSGYGSFIGNFPTGLYKMVLTLNGAKKEDLIKLGSDQNITVQVPETLSSSLAEGFRNTHEYYSEPACRFAAQPTAFFEKPDENKMKNASLFIFFRYADIETFKALNIDKESLGKNFKLLDKNRKLVCELADNYIVEDRQSTGWLAFNAFLMPGNYYLYYTAVKTNKNVPSREIPIRVCEQWQTQLYMTFGSEPLFSSLLISFKKTSSDFTRIDSETLYDIEGILQKFVNGIYFLPSNVLRKLSYGKWENPMLGILAAHSYYISGLKDHERLFDDVVENLAEILGQNTPDIQVLKLMRENNAGNIPSDISISEPCMMLTGMKTAILNSSKTESGYQIITPSSIADKSTLNLYPDIAWTSYSPITQIRARNSKTKIKHIKSLDSGASQNTKISDAVPPFSFPKSFGLEIVDNLHIPQEEILASIKSKGDSDWDFDSIFKKQIKEYEALPEHKKNTVPRKPAVLNSWVANSILNLVNDKNQQTVNISDLASSLELTPTGITKTIQTILDQEEKINLYIDAKHTTPENALFNKENISKLKDFI